ncbi:MAG TPA: DUF6448 family protein [Candidatus Udaeobacter sp.]|nr:DUF6448 family protein [Candidatus Udaeobacter sp.]
MRIKTVASIATALVLVAQSPKVRAHCDGLDGPVVQAAEKALASGDVNLVLIWVPKDAEVEIKKTFSDTLAVRKLNAQARQLADTHFFEALVRLHRASEGAGFTGLKPRGRDLGPAIPAADKALRDGNADALVQLLMTTIQNGIREHFKEALTKQKFGSNDLDAGRAFVKAYVEYIHCVEALYETATRPTHGHYNDSDSLSSPGEHHHPETTSTNQKDRQ